MQPTILVVDDDPGQLAATARILRRSRYVILTARSGRIGLRVAVQNPPDLVLLDISMPTMSGHEFLRRFRRLERAGRLGNRRGGNDAGRADIPVIFVTALSAPRQRADGLDAGAVDYVVKPFDPEELRARIRRHLRLAARQRQTLSELRMELLQLESQAAAAWAAGRECEGLLANLTTHIALAEQARQPHLRAELLGRARCDLRRLARDLAERSQRPSP